MSVPNPFSTSNAPQHNLVSKIIGGGQDGYNVAVDLVDVDTGYFRQLGSTAAVIDQIFVNTLYYSNLPDRVISEGLGVNVATIPGGVVISADLAPGYGIDLEARGNTIEINSKLAIRAGSGITFRTVTQDDNTNPDYPYGFTEIIATGGGTGSTGSAPINGSVGGVLFIQDGGIPGTDANNLFYDTTTTSNPVLYVPTTTVQTGGQNGIINLLTDENGDSIIESGFENVVGSGNFLNIQAISATEPTVTIDTAYSLVGINNSFPETALDVNGQAVINYSATAGGGTSITFADVTQSASGSHYVTADAIYRLFVWGGGGAGNKGIGGAGAYGETDIPLNAGTTLYWKGLYGDPVHGGGNAMVVSTNPDYSTPLLIVPGGGAAYTTTDGTSGGNGGPGGAGSGLPIPEGGYFGSTQVSTATYTDVQPWQFGNVSGTFNFNNVLSNEGYPDSLTGNIIGGTTMSFGNDGFGISTQFGVGSTYTVFAGNTVTFETRGISFTGGNFIIPGVRNVPVGLVTGLTFESTGQTGVSGMTGTVVYSNWPGLDGITVADPASIDISNELSVSGDVLLEAGGFFTYTVPDPGPSLTLFFNGTGSIVDTPFSTVFEITPGVVMVSSVELGPSMIGNNFSGGGTALIPPGSTLGVGERVFINIGELAVGPTGAAYGGGGATGGGAPAFVVGPGITYSSTNMPAGGGGGSYGGSLSYTQKPGNQENAFRNREYPTGTGVGDGGVSGASGGSEWLVLQKKTDTGIIPPALTVNGDEVVNGKLNVTDQISGSNGISVAQGITTNLNQEMRLVWNRVASNSGMGEIIISNAVSTSAGGLAIYNQNNSAGVGPLVELAAFQEKTATIFPGPSSSAATLTVNGNITCNDVTASSDVRTKNSIVAVDSALDRVLRMRGVFFERNTEPGERRVGVIAQEVEEVLPEVVHTDADGMKSVSYGSIIGLLIEAIKELKQNTK